MPIKQDQLDKVVKSLDNVPMEIKQMVYNLAISLTEEEIIQIFNQQSRDMFVLCIAIAKKMGKENKIKITGYQNLFEHAVSFNKKVPLEQFTLSILEFAADIYQENDEHFLGKEYEDVKLEVGNEYSFIRSQDFKDLWLLLNKKDKSEVKCKLILVTTYANAYFYKTLVKQAK